MDLRVFNLPTVNDDYFVIERMWCEFNSRVRNGESLDEVEITWMDTANNWLITAE